MADFSIFESESEREEREAFEAGNFETLTDEQTVEFEDGESDAWDGPDSEHPRFMFAKF